MHFGAPVVPELNSTYHGWSNGQLLVVLGGVAVRGEPVVPTSNWRAERLGDRGGVGCVGEERDDHHAAQGRQRCDDLGEPAEPVVRSPAVGVPVGRDERDRVDLTETVEHAVDTEVR